VVTAGTDGWNSTGGSFGSGTSGKAKASTSDLIDLTKLTPSTVVGGAGGGGGPPGGRRYSTSTGYTYPMSMGAGGGAGGGGIGIAAKGKVNLAGAIEVNGGNGGGYHYAYYGMFGGPGGAGSGGILAVHSEAGITFTLPVLSANGGIGGTTTYYSYTYTYYRHGIGGDGGLGGILVTQPSSLGKPVLPNVKLDPSRLLLGTGGTVGGKSFAVSDTAASIWIDSGAITPHSFVWSAVGDGIGTVYLEGAQSHPATGDVDTDNTTGWQEVGTGGTTVLNGYRYYRFKILLAATSSGFPKVDSFKVEWKYDK
jgi:hypothetical protein